MKLQFFAVTAALLCLACSVMNKKPNLKSTVWKCEYQEFVADAGNESVTVTLNFVSDKDYVLEYRAVMPSYPAMYMNPDGTVDKMPGYSREYSTKGTYSIDQGIVTLTDKEGSKTLRMVSDNLESDDLFYQHLVFSREE